MSLQNDDDRLDLLLASDGERKPVLGDGLPSDAAQGAPRPKRPGRGERGTWTLRDLNEYDLATHRWAAPLPAVG